eukprot:s3252_g14.t1
MVRALEYWCKLTFRSVELHLKTAWSLCDTSDVERIRTYAEKLEGLPLLPSMAVSVKGVLTPGLLSPGLLEAYMTRYELSKDQVLEQKEAFDLLDIDGNGKVTYQEVKEMNAKLGQPMSEQELSEQFTTLDIDGSHAVTFPEFLKVYVKGEFGRDVPLPRDEETLQVNDLAPGRTGSLNHTLDPIDESKMVMKLSQKNSQRPSMNVDGDDDDDDDADGDGDEHELALTTIICNNADDNDHDDDDVCAADVAHDFDEDDDEDAAAADDDGDDGGVRRVACALGIVASDLRAIMAEIEDKARVPLSTRTAGDVVKVAFKPGFAKISQGRVFCGFDRATSKGDGKEDSEARSRSHTGRAASCEVSRQEFVLKDIIGMLLPSPEHNATAIRGVPLAVIQACNWCYAVLAKDLESNEDKTPLDGLNPERVPVFPFLRLALDIIHRLEAARPGDAELVQHVLAQLLGVTDDKMEEIAAAATGKASRMEIQTVEQVLEEVVPSPFTALLFYVTAATKDGMLRPAHAKVLYHVAEMYALLLSEGWQPTFQETQCRPHEFMEAHKCVTFVISDLLGSMQRC